jgi:ABC-type dipeptide/oligopeptide/nickel transport system permease component
MPREFVNYIVNRFFQVMLIVLFGFIAAFIIFRLLPGDPTISLLDPRVPPEAREELIKRFGLDRPLYEQFLLYLTNLARGDFGYSFVYIGVPVTTIIFGERLFNTVVLMSSAMLTSALLGTSLGLIMGFRGGLLDKLFTSTLYLLASAPVFWVGLLIQFYAGYRLNMIPIAGTTSFYFEKVPVYVLVLDYIHHMIGPLTVLTLFFTPLYYIYVRNVVSSVRGEDFVLTLRALGLSDLRILLRISRFALIATVTIIANESALLIVGAVFTETIFGWNGVGRLLYDSIFKADYPVLQGIFLLTIIVVATANFIADILYYFLDPRIKVKGLTRR